MRISLYFASEIFRARTEKELTQAQVAEMADISVRWYQKLENGEAEPGLDVFMRVAKALGLDLNRLAEQTEGGGL